MFFNDQPYLGIIYKIILMNNKVPCSDDLSVIRNRKSRIQFKNSIYRFSYYFQLSFYGAFYKDILQKFQYCLIQEIDRCILLIPIYHNNMLSHPCP